MLKLFAIFTMLVPGGGKDTAYVKYETENISQFRKVPEFEVPEVDRFVMFSGESEVKMLPDDSLGLFLDTPGEWVRYHELFKKTYCDIKSGDGFRIQIYAGGDLQNANKIRADFLEVYEDISIHLDWVSPTFKVRAGDFLTRNEAMRHLSDIRQMFPDAFIVKDKVLLPKYRELKDELEEDDYEGEEGGMD